MKNILGNHRLAFSIDSPGRLINFEDNILGLGSCFSDHIGAKFARYKFGIISNPFGILFNPLSISKAISDIVDQTQYGNEDIVHSGGYWYSCNHHSRFYHLERDGMLKMLNRVNQGLYPFFMKTKYCLCTFGTAFAWKKKSNGAIVANCHRVSGSQFDKILFDIDPMFNALKATFIKWKENNSQLNVILTVSPVRHTRQGFIENQRSKSRLLLVCEKLDSDLDFVNYFPSYEILMDELRDYRYYEADLIHPNSLAIEYVWSRFVSSYLSNEAKEKIQFLQRLFESLHHRPRDFRNPSHQKQMAKNKKQILDFKSLHPRADFYQELTEINKHFFI